MKRYTRSIRTGGRSQNERVREQFTRDLTREAEKLLATLSRNYLNDLNGQASRLLQSAFGGGGSSASRGAAAADPFTALYGSATQLVTASLRYHMNKPRTIEHSQESSRSQEVDARFRLSQSQAMAEAHAAIARGSKNA